MNISLDCLRLKFWIQAGSISLGYVLLYWASPVAAGLALSAGLFFAIIMGCFSLLAHWHDARIIWHSPRLNSFE